MRSDKITGESLNELDKRIKNRINAYLNPEDNNRNSMPLDSRKSGRSYHSITSRAS
jgi:hypothetical protein